MSMNPKNPVWLHWLYDSGYGKNQKVRCRYCKLSVQLCHLSRCRQHLITCSKSPVELKQSLLKLKQNKSSPKIVNLEKDLCEIIPVETDAPSESVSVVNDKGMASKQRSSSFAVGNGVATEASSSSSSAACSDAITFPLQTSSQNSIVRVANEYVPRTHQCGHNDLVDLFVKAMITGNVPFEWADNFYLKLFFRKLDSTFVLPSGADLSECALNRIHQQCQLEIASKIRESENLSIALCSDEQSTRHKSDVNVVLCSPENIWYNTVEIGGSCVKSMMIVKRLEEMIRDIGVQKTSAIISADLAHMNIAKEIVCQRWPHVIMVNCATQALNQLLADICRLGSMSSLLAKARSVLKEVSGTKTRLTKYRQLWRTFIEDQQRNGRNVSEVSLYVDCSNRFFGMRDMLTKIQFARPVLHLFSMEPEMQLSNNTLQLIASDTFWEEIDLALKYIQPFVNGIASLETETSVLSDVVEVFTVIEDLFQESSLDDSMFSPEEKAKALSCFGGLVSKNVVSEYHYVANFLDPKYRGASFGRDESRLILVLHTLQRYARDLQLCNSVQDKDEIADCLSKFRSREGVFGLSLLSSKSGANYWRHLQPYPSCQRLAAIAARLLSIPSSSTKVCRGVVSRRMVSVDSSDASKERGEKVRMVMWLLGQHLQEANDMLHEMDLCPDASIRSEMLRSDEEVIKNNSSLDETLVLDPPFTLEQLSSSDTCEDVHCGVMPVL